MAIVSEIIYQALRKCRIRDTGDSTRLDEALESLNLMLKDWEETMLIPTRESFTLTSGTSSYTIGTGGDFSTDRPTVIMSAFIRDAGDVDYAVEVRKSVIDLDRIDIKDSAARPSWLYYANEYSSQLGKIYFNSAPESAETFYLTSYKGISEYETITDTVVQPPEYEKAMVYNLAIDLAEEYGVELKGTVFRTAIRTKNNIENRNNRIPESVYDAALMRRYVHRTIL